MQAVIKRLLMHLPKKEARLFIHLRSKPTVMQEVQAKSGELHLIAAARAQIKKETI